MFIKLILRVGFCDFIIWGWLVYIYVNNVYVFDYCEVIWYISLISY